MKTKNTIKRGVLIILLITINLGFAQSNYLKITRSNANNDFIKYPPGTTFQLIDENNNIVFSNTASTKSFLVTKPLTLKVNPPYKEETNIYYLTEGKVEIKSNANYFKTIEKDKKRTNSKKDHEKYQYDEQEFTNGLTMEKTITKSTVNPDQYNAIFRFNNGIIATFTDGEMIARLNNEILKIEGKYLIYSEFGLIKLSFAPKSGETWWVFEPAK